MTRTLRFTALATLLALAGSVHAQDFYTEVPTSEITNNGAIAVDFACTVGYDGVFIWFNFDTQEVLAYDPEAPSGSRTQVVHTASEIDTAAGVDVDRCRAAAINGTGDVVFMALASSSDNVDFLVSSDTGTLTVLIPASGATGDGITGLAVSPDGSDALFAARSQFFGAPEDGIYRLDSGAFLPVATDADLSPDDLAFDNSGNLYTLSDQFGAGTYQSVIVKVTDPDGAATLSVFDDPFDGSVFTSAQQNFRDLEIGSAGGPEYMFVLNNSFDDGEQVARYTLDGEGELFFSESDILADSDVTSADYGVPGGPNNMIVDPLDAVLYLANTDRFGGADEILGVFDPFPVAAEESPEAAGVALAAWPNPSAGRFSVALTLDAPQSVRVAVYDALGREVALLHDGIVAGPLALDTEALPAGVYLVRAQGEGLAVSRAITVVR